jgi:hypothetical protein
MLGRIDVDGLVSAAVHGEVGLTVAFEVDPGRSDGAFDGLLEDPGQHGPPSPLDLPGKAHVHGDDGGSQLLRNASRSALN